MVKDRKLNRKKGNVTLVVVSVVVALLIVLGSYMKTTTSRLYTTNKLSDTTFAREFANSLSILSIHYLKNDLLKKSDNVLRKTLSAPLRSMTNESGPIEISGGLLNHLKEKSGLKSVELSDFHWEVHKSDFKTIDNNRDPAYPCEKSGIIHIFMEIAYNLPGMKKKNKEKYHFVSDINVVANLLPVLSKFNLYIEDALNGNSNDSLRFNVVETKASGDLKDTSKAVPWVLNNGVGINEKKYTYADLVEDKRGFVYLGGGTRNNPIKLGVARGWADEGATGRYGEDFHFFLNYYKDINGTYDPEAHYRDHENEGYWRTLDYWSPEDNGVGVLTADVGLCNDFNEDYLCFWHDQIIDGFDEVARYNSIFRLYGTDTPGNQFPTLVLGYVDSMFASMRAFRIVDQGISESLSYFNDYDFYIAIGAQENLSPEELELFYQIDITSFTNSYKERFGGEIKYDDYKDRYGAAVRSYAYNNDYVYSLDRRHAWPLGELVVDENLINLCKADYNGKLAVEVPNTDKAKYRDIYGDDVDLTKLDKLIPQNFIGGDYDSDNVENKRIAYYLKLLSEEPDYKPLNTIVSNSDEVNEHFKNFLTFKGVLENNALDLNGWVYIDNKNDEIKEINIGSSDTDLKILSNGGIILSEGDINIKGNIKSSSESDPDSIPHLTIMALNGDIKVDNSVERIDASLIAKNGQVNLKGSYSATSELTVSGNIVMKNTVEGDVADNEGLKRGLTLKYRTELSAIPYNGGGEARSEKPLLMFNLKENPKMY